MRDRAMIVLAVLLVAPASRGASITAITPLSGDSVVEIFGLSADGAVAVGRSWQGIGNSRAVRWTIEGGTQALPVSPGAGDIYGVAYGISGDGNYVVGHTGDDHSFRWSEAAGMEIIGGAFANAASYDGAVVVGQTIGPDRRAYRWSESAGFQELGQERALGVSADGSIVVGQSTAAAGGFFRWSADGGSQEFAGGIAAAISADGTTIVGGRTASGGAFAWTNTDGFRGVGGTNANAVSSDGRVAVGEGRDAFGNMHATFDHPVLGGRDLDQLLRCQGAQIAGWNLAAATAISYDGNTVVGYGVEPGGQRVGWLATLDPIAHPGDTNRDERVDLDDLNLVRNYFGLEGTAVPGDSNYDCGVTLDDLNAVRNNFGWVLPSSVPEPSSVVLAAIAGVAAVLKRLRWSNGESQKGWQ